MSNEEKEKLIAQMIADGRGQELADAMVEPIRCGGCEYKDGVEYLWIGGFQYPAKELREAHAANGGHFPYEWCKAYRDNVTGNKDVEEE